jgi:hypothetical protein
MFKKEIIFTILFEIKMSKILELCKDNDYQTLDEFLINGHGKYYLNCVFFYDAIKDGQVKIVEVLIKHGADVNSVFGSHTPISIAATYQQYDMATLLIQHGADINNHMYDETFEEVVIHSAIELAEQHNDDKMLNILSQRYPNTTIS